MYTCSYVSSVYKGKIIPYHYPATPNGCMYIVKHKGLRNEPCGTLDNNDRTCYKIPRADDVWERCSK